MPGPSVSLLSPVELESAGGFSVTPAAALVVMLGAVVTMLVTAIGWGAGIWAVTQAAAGYPADLAAAFTAGVRRLGPMFGWYLLYSLMVAVGAVACLLPGLYLAVAGSLFSFVIVFERERNPFGRSFSLVHRAFGQVLGRVALLGLVTIGASCVVSLCGNLLGGGLGLVGFLMGDIATALLTAPVGVLLLVGLLLTYTQARARQEPVSTAGLWAAANESAGGPVPPVKLPRPGVPGAGLPGTGSGVSSPDPDVPPGRRPGTPPAECARWGGWRDPSRRLGTPVACTGASAKSCWHSLGGASKVRRWGHGHLSTGGTGPVVAGYPARRVRYPGLEGA